MNCRIALRDAVAGDIDSLDELHTSAMKPHVERVYRWKPNYFRETFDPTGISVVVVDDVDAGMLKVVWEEGLLRLGQISLRPEFRNRGIGTEVLRRVLEQALVAGVPVELQVLKGNPAQNLYERLGFRIVAETATHYIMMADGGLPS